MLSHIVHNQLQKRFLYFGRSCGTRTCLKFDLGNKVQVKPIVINQFFAQKSTAKQLHYLSYKPNLRSLFNQTTLNIKRPPVLSTGNCFQTRRSFSYAAIPRFFLRSLKIPAGLLGIGVGGMAYINHLLDEAKNSLFPDWLSEAVIEAEGLFHKAREGGGTFFDETEAFFSSLFSSQGIKLNDQTFNGYGSESSGGQPDPVLPLGFDASQKDDEKQSTGEYLYSKDKTARDTNFSPLIRKLIEVRSILKLVDHRHSLHLPSIVVIGSQSSGKSSVLEAIVGREFLPKGNNMVTRRPIELTLVHSPDLKEEYGVLPQLSKTRIHDFSEIQTSLAQLNQQVSASECVSDAPIELKIYSPTVPDLTLIDLPGYIQVHTKDQPRHLKTRITELCDKYIAKDNIILAVCPADVDLANSEALQASRRVDPLGTRTIGVISKLDLVEPGLGVSILENRDYPLKLGYIGLVCAQSRSHTIRSLKPDLDGFFNSHSLYKTRDLRVGVKTLQSTLIQVLEERMSKNLHGLYDAVHTELEEVRYQYKVEYNDRQITAESYVAESMDILKHRFKDFASSFGKSQIRKQIQAMLEQKVLDVCARLYWADDHIAQLGRETSQDDYWVAKLDTAAALLTKSGIGKSSTQMVVDTLMYHMDKISRAEPFVHHEDMRRKIFQFSNDIVKQKLKSTIDQVENTIKPYKYEVDCNQQEWREAQARTVALLKQEIVMCDRSLSKIKQAVGTAKLKAAVSHLQSSDSDSAPDEPNLPHFSPRLLEKAREAAWLRDRRLALKFRLALTKSRACKSSSNKTMCPEIYLQMVGAKLTTTAVMFIQVELLNEVFFQFPREVDTHLLYYGLTKDQIAQFARQNPKVARQLQLRDARSHLEHAAAKLSYLIRELDAS